MSAKPLKLLLAAFMAFSVSLSPVAALAQNADPLGLGGLTPEGRWQSENGDSRYDVTLCGEDGVSLCGKLVWIRKRNQNARNVEFIDQWVVYEAERARPAEWRGNINVYGTDYSGKVKMISNDELLMTGCILILCESYSFFRKRNPDGSRVEVSDRNTDAE